MRADKHMQEPKWALTEPRRGIKAMRRAILAALAAAASLSAAAMAQTPVPAARPAPVLAPAATAQPRAPPRPAIVDLAQLRTELQRNGPAMTADDYAVAPPRQDDGAPIPSGWGVFVTVAGRSTDLVTRGGWAVDPNVRPGEFQAGLGWRQSRVSATLGYVQPDVTFGRVNFPRPSVKALFGLHIVLHAR
jgi:hypothetical protein